MTETTQVSAMPIVTLSNGLRVANFSSPHSFEFEDGTVLPACEEERAKETQLNKVERETPHAVLEGVVDVSLVFEMSDVCRAALEEAEALAEKGDVDIILVPFPVREALCRERGVASLAGTPFRVILTKDRVTRTVFTSRFCV